MSTYLPWPFLGSKNLGEVTLLKYFWSKDPLIDLRIGILLILALSCQNNCLLQKLVKQTQFKIRLLISAWIYNQDLYVGISIISKVTKEISTRTNYLYLSGIYKQESGFGSLNFLCCITNTCRRLLV